ncbi:MAG: hypothetical protein JWM11_1668 [Planctomycetaceae bacterium]|nr:hypothetical protein [Planctomycetaceae bacterium]
MIVDTTSYQIRRSRYAFRVRLWCVVLILSSITGGLGCYVWWTNHVVAGFTLQSIPPQTVSEGDLLTVQFAPQWLRTSPVPIRYRILAGPPRAALDSESGRWQWTPDESEGGKTYLAKVEARTAGQTVQQAVCQFELTVLEHHRRPVIEAIPEQFISTGETLEYVVTAEDPDQPVSPLEYQLGKPATGGAQIDRHTGRLEWTPQAEELGRATLIPILVSKATPSGPLSTQAVITVNVRDTFKLNSETATSIAKVETVNVVKLETESSQPSKADQQFIAAIAKLHAEGILQKPATYGTLRGLFAERFAKRHETELNAIVKNKGRDVESWFKQHVELRDELYTAFGPDDDVTAGLRIIQSLHSKSFQRLTNYFELAIATAVTWDRESSVYDFTSQLRRSHATLAAEKPCDALGNFDFYSDSSSPVERRVQLLPWEFLIHVVNHRTPVEERKWAWRTYADQRTLVGRCYDDVQYDNDMIKSGESSSHLSGKPYTLPNLKAFGGICVMQADYASRVGKSLGIPAVYVEGRARTGIGHAWVIWTELQSQPNTGVAFSLESHGRFFQDRYYVGVLREPQSGRAMSDRELELRLEAVGLNPRNFRQAKLIMQVWPDLKSHLKLPASEELDFLEAVTNLNPGCQPAWQAIAKFARAGQFETALKQRLDGLRDRCFKTFANCPDFICVLIDDLLAYEPELAQRLPHYERLLQLWTNTGRRDLVCRLRIQMTDQLVNAGQVDSALGGLASIAKRFPDEGRYIPSLIDKYETVAQKVPEGSKKVLKLYQELLSLIPRRRQGQPSPFYMEMLARASQRFHQAGETKAAQAYSDQLKKLRD